MNHKVKVYITGLDEDLNLANNQSDDEVKSLLAKIICIRISGLLEVAIKSRISDYSDKKTPKEIKRFLTQKFKDITNLKTSKLCDVLGAFSSDRKDEFEEEIRNNQQIKSSLDSLITLRNDIAHGQTCSISLNHVQQYYNDVKIAIGLFDKIIK